MRQDRQKIVAVMQTMKVELITAFAILVLGIGVGLAVPEDQSMPHLFNRIITLTFSSAVYRLLTRCSKRHIFFNFRLFFNADIWLAVFLFLECELLPSILPEFTQEERRGTVTGLCLLERHGLHMLLNIQHCIFL